MGEYHDAREQVLTALANALHTTIRTEQGGQWVCAASEDVAERKGSEAGSSSLKARFTLGGTLRGELCIAITVADAEVLFRTEAETDLNAAWTGLVKALAQHLSEGNGSGQDFALVIQTHEAGENRGEPAQIGQLEISECDSDPLLLRVFADEQLADRLQHTIGGRSTTNTASRLSDAVAPELERVIDVPLQVTLRFGQKMMRLRDVLQLNTGALVELDRQVEEPVDLMLDERVIARGEVVIVDGNYGLRVTEIVERQPSAAV